MVSSVSGAPAILRFPVFLTKWTPLMTKQTDEARQAAPLNVNRRWFERKVVELKTELEKLPADRQEQFKRELEKEIEE